MILNKNDTNLEEHSLQKESDHDCTTHNTQLTANNNSNTRTVISAPIEKRSTVPEFLNKFSSSTLLNSFYGYWWHVDQFPRRLLPLDCTCQVQNLPRNKDKVETLLHVLYTYMPMLYYKPIPSLLHRPILM